MRWVHTFIRRRVLTHMAELLSKLVYGLLDRIPLKNNRTVIATVVSLVATLLGLATKQIEPSVAVPLLSTSLATIWAALHEPKS